MAPAMTLLGPEEGALGVPATAPAVPAPAPRALPALGYMNLPAEGSASGASPGLQAELIEEACRHRNLGLVELVYDLDSGPGGGAERPGLQRAVERIARGDASYLVVAGLDGLAISAAALGGLLRWFDKNGARLILPELDLETATATGRLAARALVAAGGLERDKTRDRTRPASGYRRPGRSGVLSFPGRGAGLSVRNGPDA